MTYDPIIVDALRLANRRRYADGAAVKPKTPEEELAERNAAGAQQPTAGTPMGPAPAPDYSGFLQGLYQQNFGRAADQPGLDFWNQQIQGGVTAQDIASNFARSPEAQAMRGANNALPTNFVDTYKELSPLVEQYKIPNYYAPANAQGDFLPNLAPTPATPGLTPGSGTTYTPTTPSTTPTTAAERGEVTTPTIQPWNPNIPTSNEPTPPLNPDLITPGTTPGSTGTSTTPSFGDSGTSPTNPIVWKPNIPTSDMATPSLTPPLEQLQSGQVTVDPNDYGSFVTSLYNQYLGRTPEQDAQSFFLSHLQQGSSPADVAAAIATSPEAQMNQVGSMYQYMLGRQGDEGGVNYFKDQIAKGNMDLYDVGQTLMSSPEYQNYMNQMFEANKSGFTPVNQYDFAVTALPGGVGQNGPTPTGYLDPKVWMSTGDTEVLPTSFASTILNKGLGADQQLPAGYIDPNVMLSGETKVATPYEFAANALKSGLGENGVYKPYIDASINAQKVNDLIGNMDPENPANYVSGLYRTLTGRNASEAAVADLSAQLTAGTLSPVDAAQQVAQQANVPLPPSRPADINAPQSTVAGVIGGLMPTREVKDAYQELLGRSPTAQELAQNLSSVPAGENTRSFLNNNILNSPEFAQRVKSLAGFESDANGIIKWTPESIKRVVEAPPDSALGKIMNTLRYQGHPLASFGATPAGKQVMLDSSIDVAKAQRDGKLDQVREVMSKVLHQPDAAEQYVLDMISQREGARDPNTILGDNKGAGSGPISKWMREKLGWVDGVTGVTMDKLKDFMHTMRDLTIRPPAGTKIPDFHSRGGASAVGTGQFVGKTLFGPQNTQGKGIIHRMGVTPDLEKYLKYSPEFQKATTLQLFREQVGDPHKPSTWNMKGLNGGWESFAIRPLGGSEMSKVKQGIAEANQKPAPGGIPSGVVAEEPENPALIWKPLAGEQPGALPGGESSTPAPAGDKTDVAPQGPSGAPLDQSGAIAPNMDFGFIDATTGAYNPPNQQIADNTQGYYTYETKSVPIYHTVYPSTGGKPEAGPAGSTALPTIHVGGAPHREVVGHRSIEVPVYHSGPAPEGTPASAIVHAPTHTGTQVVSGDQGDIFSDIFGDSTSGGDIFADAGDIFGSAPTWSGSDQSYWASINPDWDPVNKAWMDLMGYGDPRDSPWAARGGVIRSAVKPDDEDVENALRIAKRKGGRINTKIDKNPDFDMSVELARGGRSPAWTRKEGQNPEGGLNAKGRASAKAEGSNLKPPAPHPKTDEAAARRKSFCARMQGMKKKLTSSETKNDPDSRINKSLRVWNCHRDGGAVDNALRIAKGGEVWDKSRPKDLGKPKPLAKGQKKSAKAMAKAAGRPYPNLVDNMRAAQRKK